MARLLGLNRHLSKPRETASFHVRRLLPIPSLSTLEQPTSGNDDLMKIPGRNSPCHCGSGKKFKRCHGSPEHIEVQQAAYCVGHEAREFQRRKQQGWGRPIISTQVDEHRFVAVGNQLHAAHNWKTFHDFLRDYPRIVLGEDWWQSEILKPIETQHRVMAWLTRACEQATTHDETFKNNVGIPSTGAGQCMAT